MEKTVNLLIGVPVNEKKYEGMVSSFLKEKGKHIVCGGTTANLISKYLKKELISDLEYVDPDVPPIFKIEGLDLVTEGAITLLKVLDYTNKYLKEEISAKNDGASLIFKELLENDKINFYIGKSKNSVNKEKWFPKELSDKSLIISKIIVNLKEIKKTVNCKYY